jgi:predicted DNA-binding ribbon-helix-helix protein
MTLEKEFWDELKGIAEVRNMPLYALIEQIDRDRRAHRRLNLSSAIRIFVLRVVQSRNAKHNHNRRKSRPHKQAA